MVHGPPFDHRVCNDSDETCIRHDTSPAVLSRVCSATTPFRSHEPPESSPAGSPSNPEFLPPTDGIGCPYHPGRRAGQSDGAAIPSNRSATHLATMGAALHRMSS